jgi:hypothetical protein
MEFLIALLKGIALVVALFSPVICIFVGWVMFKEENLRHEQKSRRWFGGDLYKGKDEE